MTSESKQIVATVDTFPEWARERMRDAVLEIADVYSLMVQRGPPPREECDADLRKPVAESAELATVISLAERRARA